MLGVHWAAVPSNGNIFNSIIRRVFNETSGETKLKPNCFASFRKQKITVI